MRDLERIGDLGVNIAERAEELLVEPEVQPLVDLPVMARVAQRLLHDSLEALFNLDVSLAQKVIDGDDQLDEIYEQVLRSLVDCMVKDNESIPRGLKYIFMAKGLERVGDHSSNIAEMVIYLVRGQDIRHGKSSDSR